MTTLSGPMFEPSQTEMYSATKCFTCGNRKAGAHYNIYGFTTEDISALKQMFPNGEANDLNFVLFSYFRRTWDLHHAGADRGVANEVH